jgi:hypothetical protein
VGKPGRARYNRPDALPPIAKRVEVRPLFTNLEPRLRAGLVIALAGAVVAGCVHANLGSSTEKAGVRRNLFATFAPSKLANCTLRRYGDSHDGGYLMCQNLMGDARAAYSYGIDGRDQWGCDVSEQLRTTVHEYDCFNLTRPVCARGAFQFHEECIGDQASIKERRPYDTLSNQIARNGDSGKHLIVKMDVEGSEWTSLLATPDSLLDSIDQLVVEFHGTESPTFVDTMEKLKRHFHLVHFHANNNACDRHLTPFTSWANEVLLVNKSVGVLDASGGAPALPNPLDAQNTLAKRDCQPTF